MKRLVLVLSAFAALGATGLAAPAAVRAQTSVMVLGVRSVEGDDEFARNMTGALRHAASQVQGWDVSDRDVTLSQMALAHGCDEPDPTCMSSIADSLSTQRVIYGDVRRTSAGESFDFSVNLYLFNAETDEIEHSVAETIPGVRRDIDDLREPARRYIASLAGAPRAGTLNITVNVPGAEVFIDGESVGSSDGDGHLLIENVQAGTRNVRIVAPGHQSFRSTISVEAYGESTFEAELVIGEGGGGGGGSFPVELVTGVGLLVVAAGLAAGWIYSWYRVNFGIHDDPEYVAYRRSFSDTDPNICATNTAGGAALNPRLDELCSEASTLEVLEFVFGIGAGVAAGVGLYFIITAMTGGDDADTAQGPSIMPVLSVGSDHGYVGLRASF